MAPPGRPKITSTFCRTRLSSSISEPEIFFVISGRPQNSIMMRPGPGLNGQTVDTDQSVGRIAPPFAAVNRYLQHSHLGYRETPLGLEFPLRRHLEREICFCSLCS